MSGQASGGQKLTPNPNVFAPVIQGGSIWGANGGGAVAIGGGAVDQTGFIKPVASTLTDGETAMNYIPSTLKTNIGSVIGQESVGSISAAARDTLTSGGSNAG